MSTETFYNQVKVDDLLADKADAADLTYSLMLPWDAEETMPRGTIGGTTVSQTNGLLLLTYFRARYTATRTAVTTSSLTASQSPSLKRIGVYEVSDTGDLTLMSATPNDLTLWIANSIYVRDLSAPVELVRGRTYAVATLITNVGSPGSLHGSVAGHASMRALSPRMTGQLTAQTDLPSSITGAAVVATASAVYARLT